MRQLHRAVASMTDLFAVKKKAVRKSSDLDVLKVEEKVNDSEAESSTLIEKNQDNLPYTFAETVS